jgi:hypothetical protein
MSSIAPFIDGSYDPGALKIMGEAYDMARKKLHDRGQPVIVQEVLAGRIIALVKSGQRDPAKICNEALSSLGLIR